MSLLENGSSVGGLGLLAGSVGGTRRLTRTRPVPRWDGELAQVLGQKKMIRVHPCMLGALLLGMHRCRREELLMRKRPRRRRCNPQPCEAGELPCLNSSPDRFGYSINTLRDVLQVVGMGFEVI